MKNKYKINDTKIRLILIPGFGIIIPNLTGLFGNLSFSSPYYWIGYLYFILVAFVIWHGNRYFFFKQSEYYDWFKKPARKLVVLIFANVFYTAPVTFIMIYFWYNFAGFAQPDWNAMKIVLLMNVIAVIFITHVYETVFLIKQREHDLVNFEKLQRAKAESELEALKNQIDPHFMFNSLNTLSYLIETDKIKALEFNESLSDVYRYILMNKNKELVQLGEELTFLNNYYSLLKLRFGNSINFQNEISNNSDDFLIPPISLQILLENAVKHNKFDEKEPLNINMMITESSLIFINEIRKKILRRESSKIGLINLHERYKLITNKDIEIIKDEINFTVKLPLLKTATI
ncbi:MAG: histidine kinase [Bacteroidetes bacterium]|nr:histidine kinase [Bacteroidota bacterium]